MNIQQLNKEQKQLIVLGVLVAIVVLYVGFRFGLGPLLSGGEGRGARLEEIKAKVEEADRLLRKKRENLEAYRATRQEIHAIAEKMIPPSDNPLAWATERISRIARRVGIDIESISEISTPLPAGGKEKTFAFQPYAVRISASAGYDQLLAMLQEIQKSDPYVTIDGLTISGRSLTPEMHEIRVIIEWPIWADPDAESTFRKEKGDPS